MSRLYKRAVELTLARPTKFFGTEPNAIVIRDHRIQFSIEKNLDKEPNKSEVTITNLAERSRAEFQNKPLHVRLDAGYEGALARIFTGDMTWSASKKNGVNWETKLTLGDGARAFSHARVNRSFKAGVDAKTVIRDLAAAHGLKLPKNIEDARDLTAQFTTGFSVNGPTRNELSRVLTPHGYGWSVQDGRLQIMHAEDVRPDQAWLISEATGMIGSPEFGAPEKAHADKKAKPATLYVVTALYPGIMPGGRIKVESRAIRGVFKVQRVVRNGDTHGAQWQTEIEATPV